MTDVWPGLAPALLALVALNQLRLEFTRDLTPWKGGGFGMFSTVDSMGARELALIGTVEAREIRLNLPSSLASAARRIRALPAQENLDELAASLARLQFALDTGRDELVAVAHPWPPHRRFVTLEAVRVELWR